MEEPSFVEALEKGDPQMLEQLQCVEAFAGEDVALPAPVTATRALPQPHATRQRPR